MYGRLIIDLIIVVNDVLIVLRLFYWILISDYDLVVNDFLIWLICASWFVGYPFSLLISMAFQYGYCFLLVPGILKQIHLSTHVSTCVTT